MCGFLQHSKKVLCLNIVNQKCPITLNYQIIVYCYYSIARVSSTESAYEVLSLIAQVPLVNEYMIKSSHSLYSFFLDFRSEKFSDLQLSLKVFKFIDFFLKLSLSLFESPFSINLRDSGFNGHIEIPIQINLESKGKKSRTLIEADDR